MGLRTILRRLTTRYDNLFREFISVFDGISSAADGREAHPEWHLHAHFYPPLLRSATVRKFQVGFEMLAFAAARYHARISGAAATRTQRDSLSHEITLWARDAISRSAPSLPDSFSCECRLSSPRRPLPGRRFAPSFRSR